MNQYRRGGSARWCPNHCRVTLDLLPHYKTCDLSPRLWSAFRNLLFCEPRDTIIILTRLEELIGVKLLDIKYAEEISYTQKGNHSRAGWTRCRPMYVLVCIHAYMYVICVFICIYIYIYIYMHVHLICMYSYIYNNYVCIYVAYIVCMFICI